MESKRLTVFHELFCCKKTSLWREIFIRYFIFYSLFFYNLEIYVENRGLFQRLTYMVYIRSSLSQRKSLELPPSIHLERKRKSR